MKALIICDEKSVIEKLDKILCGCGFDTIIYNWLLKALDNIEEISPNFTIISVSDYPRHWKTLVQFINSGIARSSDKVILYTPKPLSLEEDKKAQALGVAGCFYSFEESEDGLKKLRALLGVKMSENNNASDTDINSDGMIPNVDNIVAHKTCDKEAVHNNNEIKKTSSEAEHPDALVSDKIIPDEDSVTGEDINNSETAPTDSFPAEKQYLHQMIQFLMLIQYLRIKKHLNKNRRRIIKFNPLIRLPPRRQNLQKKKRIRKIL